MTFPMWWYSAWAHITLFIAAVSPHESHSWSPEGAKDPSFQEALRQIAITEELWGRNERNWGPECGPTNIYWILTQRRSCQHAPSLLNGLSNMLPAGLDAEECKRRQNAALAANHYCQAMAMLHRSASGHAWLRCAEHQNHLAEIYFNLRLALENEHSSLSMSRTCMERVILIMGKEAWAQRNFEVPLPVPEGFDATPWRQYLD